MANSKYVLGYKCTICGKFYCQDEASLTCPECGEKLILRKGEIRRHHFAHHGNSHCTDTWHYDMSEWHKNYT